VPGDCSKTLLQIIEKALGLLGDESKSVILNYVREKYGMDPDSLVAYRGEFENYLREVLGDSAEIIAARITRALQEHSDSVDNPLCYICDRHFSPEKMRLHLMRDHTREEVARHLAVVYVDDWREDAELKKENDSALQQMLHN
jgi:hypothetical protein